MKKMDFLHSYEPRRKKIMLSTRRKINVLSALNTQSQKCLCSDKDSENDEQNIFDCGKEVMAFLQGEQFHVEHLKELKQWLIHPILKENIEPLDDIIRLVEEMLSTHSDLCSILICGKNDVSGALKQLSSCLDSYVSYSLLISLEKNSFQKIFEMYSDICMDIELVLQEPITYISRCRDLIQDLCSAVPEEVYYDALKAVEMTLNNIQNELSVRENTIRTLQIQRILFKREPRILSPGRTVIKEGILYKVNHKGSGMKQRVFFLFNDIFLCCKVLSKTFDWHEKDSLLFCALFPLNMCSVNLVLGCSKEGTLFKVTCGTMSYLLLSEVPGEAQSWFNELLTAIRMLQKPNTELKPKLNRRKNTGLKQRISPFLKQPARSSEKDFDVKSTKDKTTNLQLHTKKSSFDKIIKFLACVSA